MRVVTPLIAAALLLCSLPAYAQLPANKLEGTWEMVSQRIVQTDTTIERVTNLGRRVKILNSTHFAFGWMLDDNEEAYSGGGRYTYDGSNYIEHIEYHSAPALVGQSITFEARLEGDLWYHSGQIGSDRLEEVWRRVSTPPAP